MLRNCDANDVASSETLSQRRSSQSAFLFLSRVSFSQDAFLALQLCIGGANCFNEAAGAYDANGSSTMVHALVARRGCHRSPVWARSSSLAEGIRASDVADRQWSAGEHGSLHTSGEGRPPVAGYRRRACSLRWHRLRYVQH